MFEGSPSSPWDGGSCVGERGEGDGLELRYLYGLGASRRGRPRRLGFLFLALGMVTRVWRPRQRLSLAKDCPQGCESGRWTAGPQCQINGG